MALRDQPYIPLYVQDFLTDEKLIECSAESTGVYIRLMCILHKSKEYGTILLKQKYKQNSSTCLNFASMLVKSMPYTVEVIEKSLIELTQEDVLVFEDGKLLQKRMVRDNDISIKRSISGKKGGICSSKSSSKTQANIQANSEDEYEYENETVIADKNKIEESYKKRDELFKNEISEFKDIHSSEMLRGFYSYWSEPNKSKTKMRFEMQKTWDLKRRLNTWASRNNDFKKTAPKSFGRQEVDIEEIRENGRIALQMMDDEDKEKERNAQK